MNIHKIPGRNLNWFVSGLAKTASGLLMVLSLGFVYVALDMWWTGLVMRWQCAARAKERR
jgi:hypothetical protein